jgi:hypothetical protein
MHRFADVIGSDHRSVFWINMPWFAKLALLSRLFFERDELWIGSAMIFSFTLSRPYGSVEPA